MPFIETPKSSSIAGIEYFPESRQLVTVFRGSSAKVYLYKDVSREAVDALFTAPSFGRQFARTIKIQGVGNFQVIDGVHLEQLRKEAAEFGAYEPPSSLPFGDQNPRPGGDASTHD